MTVRIGTVVPQRAFFAPGDPWRVRLTVRSEVATDATVRIWPTGTVLRQRLAPGVTEILGQIDQPPAQERGYLVRAEVETDTAVVGSVRGAVDVLADWRDDPRYGFLSEFGPGDSGQPARSATMAALHLNCAQFYDWMYRQDELLPPGTEFRDPIGRQLSLTSVRRSIASCRERGIAPLGYAALYAGLPDFAARHENWQLVDGSGRPEHLAELFYLMNPAEAGWQEHLLGQLAAVLDGLDFEGFHLDQYGYPRVAWNQAGQRLDVGAGASRTRGGRRPPRGQATAGWRRHCERRRRLAASRLCGCPASCELRRDLAAVHQVRRPGRAGGPGPGAGQPAGAAGCLPVISGR